LQQHLTSLGRAEGFEFELCLVSNLPLRQDGSVDHEALSTVPIIDSDLLQDVYELTAQLSGTREIEVVVEELRDGFADGEPLQSGPSRSHGHKTVQINRNGDETRRPAVAHGAPGRVCPERADLSAWLFDASVGSPDKGLLFRYIDGRSRMLTYADLWRKAIDMRSRLNSAGVGSGDNIVLQLDNEPGLYIAFWACLIGGIRPVIVARPADWTDEDPVVQKLFSVIGTLGRPFLIVPDVESAQAIGAMSPSGDLNDRVLILVELMSPSTSGVILPPNNRPAAGDTAFFQLTSGSTGAPKCIEETHAAVLAHVINSSTEVAYSNSDITLNWLPLDHVVPILTMHLKDVYYGCSSIQLQTGEVISSPLWWIDVMSSDEVTHSWAPNFGFELVNHALESGARRDWNLSNVEVLMNAGEQVTLPVISRFAELLASFGFDSSAIRPAFGMAEVATCITYSSGYSRHGGFVRVLEDADSPRLRLVEPDVERGRIFVALGKPMPGVALRIVNEEGTVVPELTIGELQISGAVLTPGYYGNAEANERAFTPDGWLRTGDFAFLHAGELFLCGRVADKIRLNAVTYYAHEVESAARRVKGILPSFVGACAIRDEHLSDVGVAVFFVASGSTSSSSDIANEIRMAVGRATNITKILPVELPIDQFPKTTSGKVQRRKLQQLLATKLNLSTASASRESDAGRDFEPLTRFQEIWLRANADATSLPLHAGDPPIVLGHDCDFVVKFCSALPGQPSFIELTECRLDQLRLPEAGSRTDLIYLMEDKADVDADEIAPELRAAHLLEPIDDLMAIAKYLARIHLHDPSLQLFLHVVIQCRGCVPSLGLKFGWVRPWLRTLETEQPGLRTRYIELDDDLDSLRAATREITYSLPHAAVVFNRGGRFVPRFSSAATSGPPVHLPSGGAFLVIGGLGGIGLEVCKALLSRYRARLLIVGRRETPGDALAELISMSGPGEVCYRSADVSCEQALASAVADGIKILMQPLAGAFNLAGEFRLRTLEAESAEAIRSMAMTRYMAATNVIDLCCEYSIPFLVEASSINAIVGGYRAVGYSVACAVAATARPRKAQLRRSVIFWSGWDGVGMTARNEMARFARARGLRLIDESAALDLLFQTAVGDGGSFVAGISERHPGMRSHVDATVPLERIVIRCPELARLSSAKALKFRDKSGRTVAVSIEQHVVAAGGRDAQLSKLLQRVRSILSRPTLSEHANLLDMGLDSLKAIQLAAALRADFGMHFTMKDFLEHSTIASLCAASRSAGAPTQPSAHSGAETNELEFPVTPLQEAYLFGRNLAKEGVNPAAHFYLEVDSAGFDLRRLEKAVRHMVVRHPMLRAVFSEKRLHQVRPPPDECCIQVDDYRGLTPAALERRLEERRRDLAYRCLDSAAGPLFRISASRISNAVTRLHFDFDMLIADFASICIFMHECSSLYLNADYHLPALNGAFADFAYAQLRQRESTEYAADQAYWRARLKDIPPAPRFWIDGGPSKPGDVASRRLSRIFSAAELVLLRDGANACGVSLASFLLSLYCNAIAAYSTSSHFSVIVTTNERPASQERVIGDYTSTVLIAVPGQSAELLGSFSRTIQSELWAALSHRQFSGIEVRRQLMALWSSDDGLVPSVVFTSALDAQGMVSSGSCLTSFGNLAFGISQTPQVALDHTVFEVNGELFVNWDYVPSALPDVLAEGMFAQFLKTISRVIAGPDQCVALDLTCPDVDVQLPWECAGDTSERIPMARSEGLLQTGFLGRCREYPDRLAVYSDARQLTYRELLIEAVKIARTLEALSVSVGSVVGILLPKGWQQVPSVIGTLLASGVYVPVDPELPKERIALMLRNAGASAVVTLGHLRHLLASDAPVHVIAFEELDEIRFGERELERLIDTQRARSNRTLAYLIYTSGSTGVPKAVSVTHAASLNTILDVNERLNLTGDDSILGLSALSFDLSVYDIFGPLQVGASVVVVSSSQVRDPVAWYELITRRGVSVWNSAPLLMKLLLDHLDGSEVSSLASLTRIMLSGDWIPVSMPGRIREKSPAARIVSLGGATEAAIWSVWYEIGAVDPSWTSIPYGRPLTNQCCHVLDDRLYGRPTNVPGDLFIGGAGLAEGYYGDVEKTAKSFIIHPRTGERLYRTGDKAKLAEDGNLIFLGREDNQVKINGFRVELGEIESVLRSHPGVKEVVVQAPLSAEAAGLGRMLHAYVVPDRRMGILDVTGLRGFLRTQLPGYMIPELCVIDSLPLNQSGKLDRKQLPAIPLHRNSGPAPEDSNALHRLIEDCVGRENLDPKSNFFDLGLTSLDLVKIAATISVRLGRDVPTVACFQFPAIERLIDHVMG